MRGGLAAEPVGTALVGIDDDLELDDTGSTGGS
jgi:hypothetical protein